MCLPDKVSAWLQLVRAPNLLTVPGDPLAGLLLAAGAGFGPIPVGPSVAVVAASLLLYAAGLVWNDIADIDEDRRDRPARPLPSGRICVRTAGIAATALTVVGVALATYAGPMAGTVAAALAVAIIVYDTRAKHSVWLGPLTMALCRALSLLMGVALVYDTLGTPRGLPFVAASSLFVYITLVSVVARDEVARAGGGACEPAVPERWKRWLPPAGMAVGLASMVLLLTRWGQGIEGFSLAVGGIAAAGALSVCAMAGAGSTQDRLPQTVGAWILCLAPMQAAWCLWSGHVAGLWAGACLLVAWPLAMVAARRFYAS